MIYWAKFPLQLKSCTGKNFYYIQYSTVPTHVICSSGHFLRFSTFPAPYKQILRQLVAVIHVSDNLSSIQLPKRKAPGNTGVRKGCTEWRYKGAEERSSLA